MENFPRCFLKHTKPVIFMFDFFWSSRIAEAGKGKMENFWTRKLIWWELLGEKEDGGSFDGREGVKSFFSV